ncbi:MAG: hypothetical protein ACR2NM_14070 [Bythopirellula sp.]
MSLIGLILLAQAAVWACEDEHPPAVTTPVVERSLVDADGQEVVQMQFDPRGLSKIRTVDEIAPTLTRGGDNSSVWDYREWQWWKGHPWGDSCRPRYWTKADFLHEQRDVAIRFDIDGFSCEQRFLLPQHVDANAPHWDVVVSIRNDLGTDVEEYHQFFACYTAFNSPNSCWFWADENRLRKFSEFGVQHLDGYAVHPDAFYLDRGAIPHCPRGDGKIVATWYRPLLVSHPSPAGWRSIIMVEAKYAASLAQGIRGAAMDYILFPGPDVQKFADGAKFSVQVRHQLINSHELPAVEDLQRLWQAFEASHATIHQLAESK